MQDVEQLRLSATTASSVHIFGQCSHRVILSNSTEAFHNRFHLCQFHGRFAMRALSKASAYEAWPVIPAVVQSHSQVATKLAAVDDGELVALP